MWQRKCWIFLRRTNEKKFTLHNLHLFETSKAIALATPIKREKKEQSSSSSTKFKAKGLSQKERDLLEYLKDDPSMKQIVLQKILDKQGNSDDETVSLQHHHLPQNLRIFKILRIHINCKTARAWLLANYTVIIKRMKRPCKGQMALGKSKGHLF